MSGDVVLYRADVKGLKPGADTGRMRAWFDGREYTYATTNPDVARAVAVKAFGVARDHERSVYRVQLDDPIALDPEFLSDNYASFVMSHWGTVEEVFEADVTMSTEEADRTMARYARWVDESPMYDGDGYATVPPKWFNDTRFDDEALRQELR